MAKVELTGNVTSTSSTPDNVVASISNGLCFVIAPIGHAGTPERLHSDEVFTRIIEPAARECDYEPKRADHWDSPGLIHYDMIESIAKSPLVIANLSGNNPNVYYELALRHTLEKPVIIIAPDYENLPFDVIGSRAILFNLASLQSVENCRKEIVDQIKAIQKSPDDYYNPISHTLDLITALDDAQFTFRDVRKALSGIPDLYGKDIVKQFVRVHFNLRSQGILTKRDLRELMTNQRILEILRELYRDELLRDVDHPLDPIAISTWGASLYISAQTDDEEQLQEAIMQVRAQLRNTSEYIQVHGDLIIHSAPYGADSRWIDVTLTLQRKVVNGRLAIKASHLDFGVKDPAEGVRKHLTIEYSYKGRRYWAEFEEDDPIELPPSIILTQSGEIKTNNLE